jgi:hypothetical protein
LNVLTIRRLGISLILAATVVTVTGCAGTGPSHPPAAAPPEGTVPTPQSPAQLRDPLERYLPSPADQEIIEAGLRDEVETCVRSYGIQIPASMQIKPSPVLAADTSLATISGLLPQESAQRSGYMSASNGGGEQILALDTGWTVSYRIPATDNAVRTKLRSVLSGRGTGVSGPRLPSGGCLGAGVRALLGERDPTPGRLADDIYAVPLFLTEQAQKDMEVDPRVGDVTARWRSCMSRAGYTYSSPTAAQADPRWLNSAEAGVSTTELVAMEKPVATADARCRATVNYAGVRMAVFDAYLARLISDGRTKSRLQQFEAQARQVTANATKAP